MVELIVPDTSVLISKKLTELIENNKLKDAKIIIPNVVIDELQAQANKGCLLYTSPSPRDRG